MTETVKLEEKERQLRVSALLHAVDGAIKKGELEDALEKIRNVYKYDIKNIYARAFEERILVMMVERGEKELKVKYDQEHSKLKEEVDKKAQIEINRKLKEYHRQWEEETARREEKERQEKELEGKARKASIEEQKTEGAKDYAAIVDGNRGKMEQWEQKIRSEVQSAVERERIRLEEELAQRLSARPFRSLGTPLIPKAVNEEVQIVEEQSPVVAELAPVEAVEAPSVAEDAAMKAEMEAEYGEILDQAKEHMELEMADKMESARTLLHEQTLEQVRAEHASIQEELHRQFAIEKENLIEREQAKMKERFVEAYKTFIILMDVSIPKDLLDTYLLSLRSILGISDDEHTEIIRSVQVNSFIDTLRASWEKGSITDEESKILSHLCELYKISEEEHERLTKQVKKQLGLPDENVTIMAIDDSNDMLVFIEYILKKTYGKIRTADSVKSAVELIRQQMPSLIICDVMMPDIGGFAFYELIQKGEYGEDLKHIPFVFMSVCSDEYMKKIAEDLGVNRYLTKPFSVETLEKTVREMLVPAEQ